jgi:hypothetical protein
MSVKKHTKLTKTEDAVNGHDHEDKNVPADADVDTVSEYKAETNDGQFPSLAGAVETEIAHRTSANADNEKTEDFFKDFLITRGPENPTEAWHEPQYRVTRREAMHNGIRVREGDKVRYEGRRESGDGVSHFYRYAFGAVPAVVANAKESTAPVANALVEWKNEDDDKKAK